MTLDSPTEAECLIESARDFLVRAMWNGIDPYAGFAAAPARVDLQGWSGSKHPWFEKAIRELRPRFIVEVGVWKGASALHMAECLRREGIAGVVIAVDTWLGSAGSWRNRAAFESLGMRAGRPAIQDVFMNNVVSHNLQDYVLPLPLDSVNAAILLGSLGIVADLIHIDASHDQAAVTTDLTLWWPRLRVGGILLGDDYYHDGSLWPAVKAAYDSFTETHGLAYEHLRPKISISKTVPQQPAAALPRKPEVSASLFGDLPETLEWVGEYGTELVLFTPFCLWLSKAGLLKQRRIRIYRGMRCFYDDLDCLELIEKDERRTYQLPIDRPAWLPVRDEHTFDNQGRSPFHWYPDLRRKFLPYPLTPDVTAAGRPLLIVHNKHTNEWGGPPINHIPLAALDILFHMLKHAFTIVYIRHGMGPKHPGYSEDLNSDVPFGDRKLLEGHPEVLCFDTIYAQHRSDGGTQDINTFKNVLFSRCHHYVTSQGGGSYQMALFSGSIMIVLHRRGLEDPYTYRDGALSFMADVPPIRVICRHDRDLVRALPLLLHTWMTEDRVMLAPGAERLLAAYSPWAGAQRRG
jgi:hypothetical protein